VSTRTTTLLATAALAAAVAGCGSSGSSGSGNAGATPAKSAAQVDRTAGARATVTRYFAALGGHHATAACSQLTPESQDKLSEFGGDALHMKRHSCSRTLKRLFASPAGPRLRTLAHAPIAAAKITGDGVVVSVRGVDTPVKVVKDQGAWRIESSPTGETD
jgi:hypothetical protein